MAKLKLTPGTFSFVLRQPLSTPSQVAYMYNLVFASVDLADWKNWLPVSLPRVINDGSIIVQVDLVNPLDANRSVLTLTSFSIPDIFRHDKRRQGLTRRYSTGSLRPS